MVNMKLISALKQKNRLAGRINQIGAILTRDNSWEIERTMNTDHGKLWDELQELTKDMVSLKAKIAAANVGIYDKIERMSELKGQITLLKALPVKHGTYKEDARFGSEVVERTFQAYFKQDQIDSLVKEIQEEIYALQDAVDAYNASTDI